MKSAENNSPIICFEGPSAVGKTTLCKLLAQRYNIVPEVNLLFDRPEEEEKNWYNEKQVERYELCMTSERSSILDGDVFQPIWYNWVCKYPTEFLSKTETHDFYRSKINQGKLRFPDLYIIFEANEAELRRRKEKDKTRTRRNFEKHLKIVEPLKRYYRFLESETTLDLIFIPYNSIATTKNRVLKEINNQITTDRDNLQTFNKIVNWID